MFAFASCSDTFGTLLFDIVLFSSDAPSMMLSHLTHSNIWTIFWVLVILSEVLSWECTGQNRPRTQSTEWWGEERSRGKWKKRNIPHQRKPIPTCALPLDDRPGAKYQNKGIWSHWYHDTDDGCVKRVCVKLELFFVQIVRFIQKHAVSSSCFEIHIHVQTYCKCHLYT